MPISTRSLKISPSQTLSISALTNELIAQKKDVINLAAGQPDFPTPDYVKQAAIEAIQKDMTRYTAVDGTAELKQAIIDKFQRENQLSYTEQQVIASSGAKYSLAVLAQAVINKGDEVLLIAPFWTSYPELIKLADGEPIVIPTSIEQGFKVSPEQLEAAITKNTKMIIINSPSNPAGVCYSKEELMQLGAVLKQHPEIIVCSDDIYEHFTYDGYEFVNIVNACPELHDRSVIINGVSKCYSMTGWRIGYAAGPDEIIAAMKKIQSQSTSNPCSISQAASVAALNGPASHLDFVHQAFVEQRQKLIAGLSAIEHIKVLPPMGSFYLLVDCTEWLQHAGIENDDLQLAERLLDEHYIATIPGVAFGAPGHLRMSFSIPLADIDRACERLHRAFNS